MIEAIGTYSALAKSLRVKISTLKTVEIKLSDETNNLADGERYHITANLIISYSKEKGSKFRAQVITFSPVSEIDAIQDYANYKGVVRINEASGGVKEQQGSELYFYRGDCFSAELKSVALDLTSGWVTIAVPKAVSSYLYRAGDLLYVDGKVYHKKREVKGNTTYEICVRADVCHKVDGTEYWERVRSSNYQSTRDLNKKVTKNQ